MDSAGSGSEYPDMSWPAIAGSPALSGVGNCGTDCIIAAARLRSADGSMRSSNQNKPMTAPSRMKGANASMINAYTAAA